MKIENVIVLSNFVKELKSERRRLKCGGRQVGALGLYLRLTLHTSERIPTYIPLSLA
jgi:hypothetical protein